MKRVLLAALAVLSAGAVQAFSFVGDDWVLDYEVVYHVRTAAANSDLPETANDVPVSISQSVTNAFSFPYTLGVVEGTGDFTVSGTTVTDINSGKTTDPFQTIFNGNLETVRITYDTWTLTGEVRRAREPPRLPRCGPFVLPKPDSRRTCCFERNDRTRQHRATGTIDLTGEPLLP